MEYILINECKLKVMLDRSDLAERHISAERLDYANPEARRIFGDILQYAKREFGFDTSGHRVLLQLYPSKDGGCELFISSIGKLEKRHMSDKAEETDALQKAYSFECLDHLLSVCRALINADGIIESNAWFDSGGRWYLTLVYRAQADDEFMPLDRLSFISEYGECESSKALSFYLGEYATSVCQGNAVDILGKI